MSTGYEGGFTRRQELTCTETEMAAYADVVLYENEHIYIKMNSGMIRLKIGDGKTGLLNLPWAKVFDDTLDDVEAIVGGFASRVETNTKRIENLEAAISPEIVTPVTDSTIAYAKTVPKGALPNAAITEIGGMSYVKNGVLVDSKVTAVESVGANCIPFPYSFSAGTYNGVNLTINSDGTFALNGTATGASYLLLQTATLPAGNYYVSDTGDNDWKARFYVSLSENYFKNSRFTLTEPSLVEFRIAIYETFIGTATLKPMVNRGTEALPYSLYFRETLPIPGDALDGWGQGVNAQFYNKIVLDPADGVMKYRQICAKRGYLAGDETRVDVLTDGKNETVYILENPVETDISAYFTDDNLLRVVAGGTITAVNEFEHEVPFTVKYMIKGA